MTDKEIEKIVFLATTRAMKILNEKTLDLHCHFKVLFHELAIKLSEKFSKDHNPPENQTQATHSKE